MAWALKFDGINDKLNLTNLPTSRLLIKFKLSHDIKTPTSEWYYIVDGRLNGGVAYFTNKAINRIFDIKVNDVSVSYVTAFDAKAGDVVSFEIDQHSGSIAFAGRANTEDETTELGIEYIEVTTTSNDTVISLFDATASDHSNTGAQPVLVDTIGGNNAVGVNFPTDGSAWVDLGGGVSVNVSDSLSESASSANNDSIVYVGEFSVFDLSNNSISSANQDAISFASTVNISDSISSSLSNSPDDSVYLVGELLVNDSIVDSISSSNQDGVTLAATTSVNDSIINSISLAINDSIKLSGAFDVIEQLVNSSAIANSDLVAFSSTVSVSDQSSNSQSDSLNDEVSFVGAFSVDDQLTNSLSLANVESISFSGEIILTDDVVSSSSLSTNDFIQIGAFSFTVYKETNISSTFKSRNIDSPSLSTNIDG